MQWLLDPYRQYATFAGRASRKQYWMFQAWLCPVYLILFLLMFSTDSAIFAVLTIIFSLGSFLPSLAIAVRRLHDTDRGGAWILIGLIPFGNIVLLIFLCLEGTPGPNQYGNIPSNINSQTQTKNRTQITVVSKKGINILRLLAVSTFIAHFVRCFVNLGLSDQQWGTSFGISYRWKHFFGVIYLDNLGNITPSSILFFLFFCSLLIGTILLFTSKAKERTAVLTFFAVLNFVSWLVAERLFAFDRFRFQLNWFNPFSHRGYTQNLLWPIILYLTIASLVVVFFSRKIQTFSEDDDGMDESGTPPGILASLASKQPQASTKVAERPVIPMKTTSEAHANKETERNESQTLDVTEEDSSIDELEKLAQLHSSGVLTDDEFEAMKARIINRQ